MYSFCRSSFLHRYMVASFPGLPQLQFLIACSMQKRFLHTESDQKLELGKAWERGWVYGADVTTLVYSLLHPHTAISFLILCLLTAYLCSVTVLSYIRAQQHLVVIHYHSNSIEMCLCQWYSMVHLCSSSMYMEFQQSLYHRHRSQSDWSSFGRTTFPST